MSTLAEMDVKDIQKALLSSEYQYTYRPMKWTGRTYEYGDETTKTQTVDSWEELEGQLDGTASVVFPGLGTAKMVYQFGGEGEGETYYYVFSIDDGVTTRIFRVDGYYQSYSGATFDSEDMREVSAKQKTITVWE